MTRRGVVIAALAAAAVAAAACVAWLEFAGRLHVDIEQAEIQQRVSARFPVRQCALMLACVEFSDPNVILTDGSDRIGLTSNLVATAGPRRYEGRLAFTGRIRFEPATGEFFFDDIDIQSFELSGVAPDYMDMVKTQGPAIARTALRKFPIYTLKADNVTLAVARLTLRDVKVVHGKVRISFLRADD